MDGGRENLSNKNISFRGRFIYPIDEENGLSAADYVEDDIAHDKSSPMRKERRKESVEVEEAVTKVNLEDLAELGIDDPKMEIAQEVPVTKKSFTEGVSDFLMHRKSKPVMTSSYRRNESTINNPDRKPFSVKKSSNSSSFKSSIKTVGDDLELGMDDDKEKEPGENASLKSSARIRNIEKGLGAVRKSDAKPESLKSKPKRSIFSSFFKKKSPTSISPTIYDNNRNHGSSETEISSHEDFRKAMTGVIKNFVEMAEANREIAEDRIEKSKEVFSETHRVDKLSKRFSVFDQPKSDPIKIPKNTMEKIEEEKRKRDDSPITGIKGDDLMMMMKYDIDPRKARLTPETVSCVVGVKRGFTKRPSSLDLSKDSIKMPPTSPIKRGHDDSRIR
jgi:hypothetical protein